MKITIEIDNLTEPQRLAIEDLLAMWQSLGCIGSSRWTAFFADGDGNFRPQIQIDGKKPERCTATYPKNRWKTVSFEDGRGNHSKEMYLLDFDEIARATRELANRA